MCRSFLRSEARRGAFRYRTLPILPEVAWFDEQRLHADPAEPGSDDFGRELRAVIGTDVFRRPSNREQVSPEIENVVGPEPPGHMDRPDTPARTRQSRAEHAEGLAVMGASLNEVFGL